MLGHGAAEIIHVFALAIAHGIPASALLAPGFAGIVRSVGFEGV